MGTTSRKINRTATDRLVQRIESELTKRGLNGQEVAREARLPADAFRSLRRGYRPTIDRADELCRALGISMTIGAKQDEPTGSTNSVIEDEDGGAEDANSDSKQAEEHSDSGPPVDPSESATEFETAAGASAAMHQERVTEE